MYALRIATFAHGARKEELITMVILRPVGTTGNRLKYLRKIRGLTREEAAVKLNIKEERLQDLETGRKGLTLGEAIKCADIYNVSIPSSYLSSLMLRNQAHRDTHLNAVRLSAKDLKQLDILRESTRH